MKHYNEDNVPYARKLRKNMTPWERKLWYLFLNKYPVRFQRQKLLGDHIADFYCAKAKLVIELDGGGHYEEQQQKADIQRTALLEATGLHVLRICNLDIDRNFRGVCEFIDLAVRQSLPQSACSADSPLLRGGQENPHTARKQKKIFSLGFFDGVHLGHQALLDACCRLATEQKTAACAVTFDLPPSAVLQNTQPNMLSTVRDRQMLLRRFGMDKVRLLQADKQTLSMSWTDFLEMLIEDGAAGFVCGYDFRFGKNGEGNAQKLAAFAQERKLPCVIVLEQTMDGEKISSSRIRTLLEAGNIEKANDLLGHPHIFTGTVVSGQKLGRTIGIPTANLHLPEELITPAFGVYACTVRVDDHTYVAVTNIGTRPTVDGQGVTVEPWILDFDGDLYGKEITLQFHKFLRPEQKFANLEELKLQIQKDAEKTSQLLSAQNRRGGNLPPAGD